MPRLDRSTSVLFLIDVQEKLMPVIANREELERNLERLIRGAKILGVPIVLTEQYVKGLGHTIAPLREALGDDYKPIEKACFSGYRPLDRKQVIVAGIETHVCVYQTVSDLLANGYEVTIVADAVSSRTVQNKEIALGRMTADGAKLSSTEMGLFELTVQSGTDEFRAISKLVK
ncbi:MAG TPA: hydrolase [Thermoanaerobaculia bacterium]|nr:hydrolase [Thermoanaerobaculia bacterium]